MSSLGVLKNPDPETGVTLRRVYRSGGFARASVFSLAVLYIACLAIGMTVKLPSSAWDWLSLCSVSAVLLVSAIRAAGVGVWITPAGLVARSWFRTWRFPPGTVRRCDREPYSGLLKLGYGESGFNCMLRFALEDGSLVTVSSTIAPRKTSQKQVLEVQDYLKSCARKIG